jgi:hypothetical protein
MTFIGNGLHLCGQNYFTIIFVFNRNKETYFFPIKGMIQKLQISFLLNSIGQNLDMATISCKEAGK